jgi:hypothetical protein
MRKDFVSWRQQTVNQSYSDVSSRNPKLLQKGIFVNSDRSQRYRTVEKVAEKMRDRSTFVIIILVDDRRREDGPFVVISNLKALLKT